MELLEAMDRGERPWEARRAKEESKTSRECALPLTDECHHYTKRRDVGWDVQKYKIMSLSSCQLKTNLFSQILGSEIQHILSV